MNIIRRLWNPKGPPKRPGQSDEERDRQINLAREKKERKAAKARKLIEAGHLKLYEAPQYKPWSEASKDLRLERLGVDHSEKDNEKNSQELYEPAKLEEKQ